MALFICSALLFLRASASLLPETENNSQTLCLANCLVNGRKCGQESTSCRLQSEVETRRCREECEAKSGPDCSQFHQECVYQCNFLDADDDSLPDCKQRCELGLNCCKIDSGLAPMEPPIWVTPRYCYVGCFNRRGFCEKACDEEVDSHMDQSSLPHPVLERQIECVEKCRREEDNCKDVCEANLHSGICHSHFERCVKSGRKDCAALGLCCMTFHGLTHGPSEEEKLAQDFPLNQSEDAKEESLGKKLVTRTEESNSDSTVGELKMEEPALIEAEEKVMEAEMEASTARDWNQATELEAEKERAIRTAKLEEISEQIKQT